MSDVRAAAERLSDRDLSKYQGPTGDDADIRAGVALAREWLREHPADEDEAVTEEWLRSVGFSIVTNFNGWYADIDIDGVNEPAPETTKWRTWLRLHAPDHDGECVSDVFAEDDDGDPRGIGLTKSWPKTRGAVRRLCLALGITLTEAKGEGT